MDTLDDVGFATISERRARRASATSPLARCSLVVTERCNLRCVYCNKYQGEDMPTARAVAVLGGWADHGLGSVMITGGEPTLHPELGAVVATCRRRGIGSVILGTNGTATLDTYNRLIDLGVTELSVSLDASTRERAAQIHRVGAGAWDRAVANVVALAGRARMVVGLVLDEQNLDTLAEDLRFIHGLGPADVKVSPSSHLGRPGRVAAAARTVPRDLLQRYPFLAYRLGRLRAGRPARALHPGDSRRCWLAVDDMAACGRHHYPCYIYLREGGAPVGELGGDMAAVRRQRLRWIQGHDTHDDPICARSCVDFYVDHNNRVERWRDRRMELTG